MTVTVRTVGVFGARLLLAGCSFLSLLPQTAAQYSLSVADRQSVDAFISIEDGQPGDPGEWELSLKFSWEKARLREPVENTNSEIDVPSTADMTDMTGNDAMMRTTPMAALEFKSSEEPETRLVFHDIFEGEWELKYTGKGSRFRENMKLSILQSAELSDWDAHGNGDIELNWQQRWREESENVPTLASRMTLRLPTGRGQAGYGLTLTGILIKDIGPGALYLNTAGTVPFNVDHSDVRDFLWSASLGYKWQVSNNFSLYANYVIQSSEERGREESNTLEFAAQFDVHERFTLGPGVLIGLDNRDETPEFGAGVKITIGL